MKTLRINRVYSLLLFLLMAISCNDDDGQNVYVIGGSGTPPVTSPANCTDTELVASENYNYADCQSFFSCEVFDITTWNIEWFPKASSTISKVKELVVALDTDIIALQEVNDVNKLYELANQLEGWEAIIANVRYDLELGFLYKTSEIESISSTTNLFGNSSYEFPREVVKIEVKHINGLEVTLLNLHLKCCNEGEQRRQDASDLLKAYIDVNLPTGNVVVLGDFNDDLKPGSPFTNFIDDPENYEFADMSIALGSSSNWSYPSYPSHIDHLLISNELFDKVYKVQTIGFDDCIASYNNDVSDHRPVMISLTN